MTRPCATFIGINRQGRHVTGRLRDGEDVAEWTAAKYRARWRRLEVFDRTGHQLSGIAVGDVARRRVWWAEASVLPVEEEVSV